MKIRTNYKAGFENASISDVSVEEDDNSAGKCIRLSQDGDVLLLPRAEAYDFAQKLVEWVCGLPKDEAA